MTKTVTVTVKDGGFLDLEDFRIIVDVDKVVYYDLKINKNKNLTLKFYDKKKKLIRPYV